MNRRKFFKATAIVVAGVVTPIASTISKSKNKTCNHDFEYVYPSFLARESEIYAVYWICRKCDYVKHNPNNQKPICVEVENTNDLMSEDIIHINKRDRIVLHIRKNKVWLLPVYAKIKLPNQNQFEYRLYGTKWFENATKKENL